jgi:Spy/CpxP family protein refolding chaperone
MKLTKTLILAALCAGSLFAADTTLRAQDATTNTPPAGAPAGGGMRGRGLNFDQVSKQLELTDDQKPKVKAVLDDMQQKMRDLRNGADYSSLSQDDRRAKMKAIRDDVTTKLKDILTPDQFAKWQKMAPGQRRPKAPPTETTNAPAATP